MRWDDPRRRQGRTTHASLVEYAAATTESLGFPHQIGRHAPSRSAATYISVHHIRGRRWLAQRVARRRPSQAVDADLDRDRVVHALPDRATVDWIQEFFPRVLQATRALSRVVRECVPCAPRHRLLPLLALVRASAFLSASVAAHCRIRADSRQPAVLRRATVRLPCETNGLRLR